MLTMLLGGLWHGASWNFVVWGGLHGLYLTVHKIILGNKKPDKGGPERFNFSSVVRVILTFVIVLFTWLFFRSTSWDSTLLFANKIINWEASEYSQLFISISLVYLLVTIVWDILEYSYQSHTRYLELENKGVKYGILASMFFVSLVFIFQADPLPFIYFQF